MHSGLVVLNLKVGSSDWSRLPTQITASLFTWIEENSKSGNSWLGQEVPEKFTERISRICSILQLYKPKNTKNTTNYEFMLTKKSEHLSNCMELWACQHSCLANRHSKDVVEGLSPQQIKSQAMTKWIQWIEKNGRWFLVKSSIR